MGYQGVSAHPNFFSEYLLSASSLSIFFDDRLPKVKDELRALELVGAAQLQALFFSSEVTEPEPKFLEQSSDLILEGVARPDLK